LHHRRDDDGCRVLRRQELMPSLEHHARVIRKQGPNRGIVGEPRRVLQGNSSEDRPAMSWFSSREPVSILGSSPRTCLARNALILYRNEKWRNIMHRHSPRTKAPPASHLIGGDKQRCRSDRPTTSASHQAAQLVVPHGRSTQFERCRIRKASIIARNREA
jgi:hypothetical protein